MTCTKDGKGKMGADEEKIMVYYSEEEELETTLFERRAPNLSEDSKLLRWQLTETFEPIPQSIWKDIDMLEGDPAHRGMAMCNARFKPFWFTAEASECEGLWDKGVLKKWNRSNLLKNEGRTIYKFLSDSRHSNCSHYYINSSSK